jgi:single-strand selective monofunctional uracil DNA glycosylase
VVADLSFSPPVTHVYNPLDYAWKPHRAYLERFGAAPREVLLVGMNPGPWGMAQTGVPFGEVSLVREWMGIEGVVGHPSQEHPKRPIQGFACRRSEVSGRRVWSWARDVFGTPERFFARFFVYNYCPLLFLEESGRNRTPDRLGAGDRAPLLEACDRALRLTVEHLQPKWVVGVGGFAAARAKELLDGTGPRVGRVLHPSPASPAANRGWAERATRELRELGIEVPGQRGRARG